MKKIIKHWPTIRNCMAGLALVCGLLAAGTSDYHVMELGTEAPATVNRLLLIGFVLMLPTIFYLMAEYVKERTK